MTNLSCAADGECLDSRAVCVSSDEELSLGPPRVGAAAREHIGDMTRSSMYYLNEFAFMCMELGSSASASKRDIS
jgi:hypothetical protein